MMDFVEILLSKGYSCQKFDISTSQHAIISVCINGKEGRFVLDTGASSTCIEVTFVSFFGLEIEKSTEKAFGVVTSDGVDTFTAKCNNFCIGNWQSNDLRIIALDLSHVNQSLATTGTPKIHGVLGADVLLQAKALIDYNHKKLYLL